jgi:hypothetical protein
MGGRALSKGTDRASHIADRSIDVSGVVLVNTQSQSTSLLMLRSTFLMRPMGLRLLSLTARRCVHVLIGSIFGRYP